MDLPAYKVLPFPFYLKVLGTSLLVAGPVWYTRVIFIGADNIIIGLLFTITIFLALFSMAATLFKVITTDDWRKFKDWIMMKFLKSKG